MISNQLNIADNGRLKNSGIDNISNWSALLVPVPMGIAVMSQLLIHASRVRDFSMDNSDKTKIPLIKHPESFRTTLVQIANESYEAFMKAHSNMERMELQLTQVPGYAKDCIRYMKSEDKVMETLIRRRLERIKTAANDGAKLTKEVSNAFLALADLIRQVLSASSLSIREKEKEVVDKFEEVKEIKLKEKWKQHDHLQQELEEAKNTFRLKGEYLDQIRKSKWHVWLQIIGYESKAKSLEHAQQMKEEADKQLKQIKEGLIIFKWIKR